MFCGHQILSHHFSLVTKNSCSNLRQLLMALSFSNGTMGSWVSPSSLTPPPFYPISINCSTDCAQHEFKVLFRPKHLYGLKHPCFRTISRSEQSSLCFHKTWGIPQKRSTSTANTLWKSLREMLQEHLNGSSTDWHPCSSPQSFTINRSPHHERASMTTVFLPSHLSRCHQIFPVFILLLPAY